LSRSAYKYDTVVVYHGDNYRKKSEKEKPPQGGLPAGGKGGLALSGESYTIC
jgi:hypothetical protein